MLRAYTDAKTDKQYFFEGKNTNQTLGLYRNANNKLTTSEIVILFKKPFEEVIVFSNSLSPM